MEVAAEVTVVAEPAGTTPEAEPVAPTGDTSVVELLLGCSGEEVSTAGVELVWVTVMAWLVV